MEFLGLLCVLVVIVPLAVVFQSFLFRLISDWIGGVEVSWGAAVLTVVIAGVAQSTAMGCFGGADAGIVGTLLGFCVWAGVAAWLNGMSFGKAALVALLMSITQWLLSVGLAILLVVAGVGAVLGLAALA